MAANPRRARNNFRAGRLLRFREAPGSFWPVFRHGPEDQSKRCPQSGARSGRCDPEIPKKIGGNPRRNFARSSRGEGTAAASSVAVTQVQTPALPLQRGLVEAAQTPGLWRRPPMILLRSLLFHASFYLLTAALAIFGLPILLLNRHRVQSYAKFWTGSTVWLLKKICNVTVEWRGLENLPRGACIIASKHQSTLETMALTTKGADFSFILKRELVAIPLLGWYLKGAGQLGIDRSKGARALSDLARQARAAIEQGRQLIIFPEGTRKPVGSAPDYKPGVAYLYSETKAPCIPVALNTGLFWPRHGLVIRRGKATIAFLPPIEPGLDKKSFLKLLEARTETAAAELAAEALAADPALNRALPAGS